jgi:hypothetical protein
MTVTDITTTHPVDTTALEPLLRVVHDLVTTTWTGAGHVDHAREGDGLVFVGVFTADSGHGWTAAQTFTDVSSDQRVNRTNRLTRIVTRINRLYGDVRASREAQHAYTGHRIFHTQVWLSDGDPFQIEFMQGGGIGITLGQP